tara:strand:+ start:7999 stop:9555 length:1557 start_codon:yes stop_codon:yes gene_type:complete
VARGKNPKANAKANNKAALKPVTLSLPGQGLRTVMAGEAVQMMKQQRQAGQIPLAAAIAQQISQQVPALDEPWLLLFGLLHNNGNFPALAQEAERCLTQKPKFIPALISRAAALRMQQQHGEALTLIEKALKLEPGNAEILNHLGITLKEMGRIDDALKAFNRCAALAPDNVNVIWNRADMAGQLPAAEYERCCKLAENPKLPPNQRAMAFYAVAHSDEAAGNYDQQFDHIQRGAEIKRAIVKYDHAAEIAQINRVADFYPQAFFATTERPGNERAQDSAQPIFICGLPRSGTTLTEQILSSHPLVIAGDELNDLPIETSKILRKKGIKKDFPDWAPDFSEDDFQAIADGYMNATKALQQGGFFTDKNLQNYKAVGLIRKAFPQAKIIICRRDPMDNLWGCYRQYFTDGMDFTYDLNELADIWLASDRLIRHWQDVISDLHILEYEQLTREPQQTIRGLLDYCGLEWDDACLNFHTNKRSVRTLSATQVRKPMTTARVAQWKRYEKQLSGLQEKLGLA